MSAEIEFHPEATHEAVEAHQRYAKRSGKAAERFFVELQRAVDSISEFPDRYPRHTHGTRVFLMRRFPYLVIYMEQVEQVIVVAVAHGRRRPGYWKRRLKS